MVQHDVMMDTVWHQGKLACFQITLRNLFTLSIKCRHIAEVSRKGKAVKRLNYSKQICQYVRCHYITSVCNSDYCKLVALVSQ